MKKILIIAGEASSDMYAADLVANIRLLDKDASFFGLGGDRMQDGGVEILHNVVRMAFIGPGGLLAAYFKLRSIYNALCRHLDSNRPDLAILIDYAEFNLRVAKYLKGLGVPVIYYISPQVWAWGAWRIDTIKGLVDKMLVLLKFEEDLYKKHGVDVKFVGHPLLDIVKPTMKKDDMLKELGIDKGARIMGLLPGSRRAEIEHILPIMLEACGIISNRPECKGIEFVLPLAQTIDESLVKEIISRYDIDIKIVRGKTYDAVNICECAMVASGTATLETALLNVPMAILYKVNLISYLLTRSVIKLPYIGLVNVIAGERVASEFLQYQARPKPLADYMVRLLNDKTLASDMRNRFAKLRISLGEPGASGRAAREVVDILSKS